MKTLLPHLFDKFKPGAVSIGLEITDAAVKMTEAAVRRGGAVTVRAFAREALPEGVVEEGRVKDVLRLMQTIQALRHKAEIKTKRVHLILPSQLVMVRFIKLPDIPEREMRNLVSYELQHNIHLPFDEPHYDFVKLNGENNRRTLKKASRADRKRMEAGQGADGELSPFEALEDFGAKTDEGLCDVMLAAAAMELVDEYREAVVSAGLEPVSMEIKALSLYRALVHTGQADPLGTLLLVDINERATDVSIFHGGQLKITRSIPLHFTAHQAEPEKPADPLELILLGAGVTGGNELESIGGELAHELERLINFYRYTLNNRDQEFGEMLVSGDIDGFPEAVDYLRGRMSLDVTVVEADAALKGGAGFRDAFPALIVPFGLALRGRS